MLPLGTREDSRRGREGIIKTENMLKTDGGLVGLYGKLSKASTWSGTVVNLERIAASMTSCSYFYAASGVSTRRHLPMAGRVKGRWALGWGSGLCIALGMSPPVPAEPWIFGLKPINCANAAQHVLLVLPCLRSTSLLPAFM